MKALLIAVVCLALNGMPPAQTDDPPSKLMEHGHWKRVRSIAQTMLKAAPDAADANNLMARVLLEWGEADKARAHAERAVQAAPQNAEYRWTLARVVGEQAERASVFSQIGLARKFRSETEKVLQADPNHIEAHYGMMLYYFKAPGIVGGDKKKAYAEADAIGRIDRAKGYLAKVRLAQEEQQRDKLPELYRHCLEANPKEFDCHIGMLNVYANQTPRNAAGVETHARQLIALAPDRVSGYSALAWALAVHRRWTDLDTLLSESERKVPDDLLPFYVAGNLLMRDGEDFPRAERYLRKYLTQEREPQQPTHGAANWRLGLVLEKLGRTAEAIAALEAAVRLDPRLDGAKKDLNRLRRSG